MEEDIYNFVESENRFKLALEYNPHYALAHYYLWTLYNNAGQTVKAENHKQSFLTC